MMGAAPKLDLEYLLDLLAERVAAKVRAEFSQGSGSAAAAVKPRLLTVDQAAVRIGRSKEAVHHMVASRKLPVVRDGRRVFIDIEDLDRWIEANKEPARD
jgi:excisionase family DNA binding protein